MRNNYHYPNTVLQLFSRAPEAGKCKSRLAQSVGTEKAAYLQSIMLDYLVGLACHSRLCHVQIWYSGNEHYFSKYSDLPRYPQQGKTLGNKMQHSMRSGLTSFDKVIIVGSDCVGLTESSVQTAILQLDVHDMVIAPANDGGYTLLGGKSAELPAFNVDAWGSKSVYQDTLSSSVEKGYSLYALEQQIDVDTLEDLQQASSLVPRWQDFLNNYNDIPLKNGM